MDTPTPKSPENAATNPGPINKLGDEEILHILEHCFTSHNQRHLRLVNKCFAKLAFPLALRTLSICSPDALERLIHSSNGPLFHKELSKHILCLEILFSPSDFVIASDELPQMCPNLVVVRFRFDLGVDGTKLPGDEAIQRLITHDTVFAEKRQESHQAWVGFFSKFNPTKFEWVSSNNRTLRLVGVHGHLRQLFHSWKSLELLFLDGICLLEEHNGHWRVWLPVNTVAVKGPFYNATLRFLYKTTVIQASPSCHLLMLEACQNAHEMQQRYALGVPAVSLLGNTLVTTVGWSHSERDLLVSGLTRFRCKTPSNFRMSSQGYITANVENKSPPNNESPNSYEWVGPLCLILIHLFCHVFVISRFTLVRQDVTQDNTAFKLDGFVFIRIPSLLKNSAASSSPVSLARNDRLPIYIGAMDPVAIPSCWCSCDQSAP